MTPFERCRAARPPSPDTAPRGRIVSRRFTFIERFENEGKSEDAQPPFFGCSQDERRFRDGSFTMTKRAAASWHTFSSRPTPSWISRRAPVPSRRAPVNPGYGLPGRHVMNRNAPAMSSQ
jgi:hypothetical protein